jgi:DNA-binding transcriptional ArsR family regulator
MSDVREISDNRGTDGDGAPLDYELAPTVRADTPEQLKALGDRTRWAILDLILERAATTTELAEALERPKGTVDHHLKVLERAGLVRVVRTRRVRAITERYWGRTGRTIMIDAPAGHPDGERGTYMVEQALVEIRATPAEMFDAHPGFSTLRHARVSRERMEEFVARLDELAAEFVTAPRSGDVVFGLLLSAFPTNLPRLKDTRDD